MGNRNWTIWDLKVGDEFVLVETRERCSVIVPTEDGSGLVALYLTGDLAGQRDFVFEHEIDFSQTVPSK